MTYEETQLIYKDMCPRVPFGVAYHWEGKAGEDEMPHYLNGMNEWMIFYIQNGNVKPYLRSLSGMTDAEKEEFRALGGVISYNPRTDTYALAAFSPEAYDWLNANHFDYRGLIEMGLALEAPDGMYKTE